MILGGITFSTKIALKSYCQRMLNHKIDLDEVFVLDLLRRHPEFEEKYEGHCEFVIIQDMNHNCFASMKHNGDIIKFSYTTCIDGKGKTDEAIFSTVCRNLIQPQIMDFRASTDARCFICNASDNLHVDHVKPFSILRDEWWNTIPYETCDVINEREFENSELNLSWCYYHSKYANLQYLCVPCHKVKSSEEISRPKKILCVSV